MDWIQGMQNAIRYIEDNITEELDYDEIANKRMFQASISKEHSALSAVLLSANISSTAGLP